MTGLVGRAFTWPTVKVGTPVNSTGVALDSDVSYVKYGSTNNPGNGVSNVPAVVSQAVVWAKSVEDSAPSYALPSFETTNPNNGWAKFPLTEAYFIKKWRGVSRLAIVDVPDEISVDVPAFDSADFNYIDEFGEEQTVDGVEQRIDLVFIYSKSIDASSATVLKPGGREVITAPQLGIVRGAGIKANFSDKVDFQQGHQSQVGDDHKILAAPGDQGNSDMGFLATSANDIANDVRGSFPAPDDILNLAPLISEKLENDALELVGQSILPVAYVWVKNTGSELTNGSIPVLSTDVVDIRPFFRTAELAYNERAGIGAAFPQLSIANPAVGKSQMDYENKKLYDYFNNKINAVAETTGPEDEMTTLAAGYVFGGWNFGPEGALFDYYQTQFGADDADVNNPDGILGADVQAVRQYVKGKYGIGSNGALVTIPSYPDWDLAQWCIQQDIDDKGLFPNDYINTFFSGKNSDGSDPTVIAGSFSELVNENGTTEGGGAPGRLQNFNNNELNPGANVSRVNFHYIAKRIKFNRSAVPWLGDYKVDVNLVNCLPQVGSQQQSSTYHGWWVEKGYDEFTIYVAFAANDNNIGGSDQTPRFPAPHSLSFTSTGKKKKTTSVLNVSDRAGERFSSFVVPVSDILTANTDPVGQGAGEGYVGNPRIGKCTYPTIMWSITGVPINTSNYFYGNLNSTNPTISLKSN
jgi:hypothetical protein